MAKTNNNSLKLQRAVRSLFYDYQEKKGCLGTTYAQAACGCDNALQMWRGPKGEKGDPGPQGPKGDNAGSFLVSAEFVVDPAGQPAGSYLKLVLIDVAQQEQVVYVNLSELEDVYSAGNGIDITSMVIAAKLGAGLTFDQQGNITSAYQFCDGLDETSNVVTVKLDASNNILGFAGSGCKGLTATVSLAQSSSGVNLVLTGANGAVLSTIPLEGGTGITVQKNAQTGGFTWLVDFSDVVSGTAGNNLTISNNKLYVGDSALTYTVGDGVFTLTNASGGTSSVTLPTVVRSLDRADLVCEGANAPYLRLTFKRDNGQNLYQDVSLACLASALDVISDVNIDVQCETSRDLEPVVFFSAQGQVTIITQEVYEEILEDPRAPYDTVAEGVVELGEAYTLELQGTSTSAPEPPLYLDAGIISDDDSSWTTADSVAQPSFIPLADVIAAGAEGYQLLEPVDIDPTTDWVNYPDRRVRIVVTVDSSGDYYMYTLAYYWDNGVSDKPTTDLVITNAGGDETRVDLNPAINHVGGEVKAVTNPDDRTRVTLRDWPHSAPFEYPAGFYADINAYASLDDVCDDNPLEFLSSTVVDNVFYTYYQSGTPAVVSMYIEDINDDETTNYIYQTYLTVDTGNNYACLDKDGNASVADLVSTGVVLYAYDSRTEKRLDDKQLYVIGELVEDGQGHPGIAIRAYLQGVKKVLRLGPSCSSDIPLADLGGISGAALDIKDDDCVRYVIPETVPIGCGVEVFYMTQQRYEAVLAGTETRTDSYDELTPDDNAEATTRDVSSYYAACITVGLRDCCVEDCSLGKTDSYSTPNIENVPGTLWEAPWYPIPISQLLAAGDAGIELNITAQYGSEPMFGTDKVVVITTANNDGSLTLRFRVRGTTAVATTEGTEGLKADLVLTDTGGNETRVDMKPLLSHVGGEVKDVVVGNESVPLIGADEEETYAGFVIDAMFAWSSAANFCTDESDVNAVSTVTHDGVVDICYDSTPVAFEFDIYRVNDAGQEIESGVLYTTFGSDECSGDEASSHSLIESYIAAGSEGLPLYRIEGWNWSASELSDICLVVTPLEGENCYRFSVVQAQIAQRLCLEPSCDPCIDLTPAIGDAITSVSGTVSCGATVTPFEAGAFIDGEYSDASNNTISGIRESVSSNAQVTFELPQGTATLFPTVWIDDPNDSNISYSYVFSNGIPVSELTVGARFCSDERFHGYTSR